MSETVRLRLPFIAAAQAQKHITHNEALRILDAIVMLSVKDRVASAPPVAPDDGDRYLVKPDGTGTFEGKDGQIAHYRDGGWAFHIPRAGWLCYVEDEDVTLVFDGAAWVRLLGENAILQNVARLGIATTADETNPLSAKLNNVLCTARYGSEGGDGDLRYKLNKEAAGNTLSLLFQTGYSGRAEIGLAGDDDLRLKVSDDGASWREAIVVTVADGRVSFPCGIAGARERLTAPRTYFVRTDGNDANDGLSNDAGGAFATLQKAAGVVFGTLDLGGHDVTVQVADGSYAEGVHVVGAQVGAGRVIFRGNAVSPGNVQVASATHYTFTAEAGAFLTVRDMELSSSTRGCLQAARGGVIYFSGLRIAATAQHQIRADDQGRILCEGDYAIVAGAGQSHWNTVGCGVIRVQSRTVTLTGTPNFPNGFAWATTCSAMFVNGNTFSGAGTGPRYTIESNAAVLAGGPTYLPGDSAGSELTGGRYL